MLKSVARAAGFLAYLFITLEMLFMVTPFALYYYAVYSPLFARPFSLPATAWLPAFFLPHLSTDVLAGGTGQAFAGAHFWPDTRRPSEADCHLRLLSSRHDQRSIRTACGQPCSDHTYDPSGTEDCGRIVSIRGWAGATRPDPISGGC